jgi:hypothetical protein
MGYGKRAMELLKNYYEGRIHRFVQLCAELFVRCTATKRAAFWFRFSRNPLNLNPSLLLPCPLSRLVSSFSEHP